MLISKGSLLREVVGRKILCGGKRDHGHAVTLQGPFLSAPLCQSGAGSLFQEVYQPAVPSGYRLFHEQRVAQKNLNCCFMQSSARCHCSPGSSPPARLYEPKAVFVPN